MKYLLTILVAVAIGCIAYIPTDGSAQSTLPQIRKERHVHQSANVSGYTDFFYRGKERILIQGTFTKPTASGVTTWREYMAAPKTVVKEIDYGGRKPQEILVYRDDALYEAFRRQADGSVEPIDSVEIAKIKEELRALTEELEKSKNGGVKK